MIILLALVVISLSLSAYFYYEYSLQSSANQSNVSEINYLLVKYHTALATHILLQYGNGTAKWYNGTIVTAGENLYAATVQVTNGNVSATYYPSFGEHLVTAIYGVGQTKTTSWFYWQFNATSFSWQVPSVGADEIMITNGTSYAWTLCTYNNSTFVPNCKP